MLQENRHRIKIPYDYLSEDCDSVYYFLLVKQAFSNGIIYDPRKHRIYSHLRSRGINISVQKITNYIEKWQILGWIERRGKSLYFASNRNKRCVSVLLKNLKYEIRRLKTLNNLKQQQFARDTKVNLKNPRGNSSYRDYKRSVKNLKKLNGDTRRYDLDLKLSYHSIASIIGMSHTTAVRLMDRMISDGYLIKYKARYYRRSDMGYLNRVPNAYALA